MNFYQNRLICSNTRALGVFAMASLTGGITMYGVKQKGIDRFNGDIYIRYQPGAQPKGSVKDWSRD